MLPSRDKLFLASLILAFALVPGAFAQMQAGDMTSFPGSPRNNSSPATLPNVISGNGAIVGSVRTLDNKPVPNARIEVTSPVETQPAMAQFTSSDGSFIVSGLRSGMYDVKVEWGVLEAEQRVQVNSGQAWVTVRMPDARASAQAPNGSTSTVSVQQLHVPDKAASLLQKGQLAMAADKLDEAGKYISKALTAYPEYSQALALRGVLELHAQQLDKASADADHAIQADPNDGMGYMVMGAVLNVQQKYQEALRPLARAETLMPGAWQGYFETSKALLQLQKFQDALQQVNKAIALSDPARHPELHLVKGYAYMGLRAYGAALGELEQYVSQVPAGPYTASVRSTLEKIRPLAAAAVPR